tara:strand:- start:884 stop:1729 length:846 start_codon:yes stop_codon:yes gene_type:complete
MNIFNALMLIGKVVILISIIIIFSIVNIKQKKLDKKKQKYNNKPEDEEFSILEGYTNKMKETANSGYFDGTCKIKMNRPIYLFFKLLGYLLYGLNWLWVNLLKDPISQLLKKSMGKYYVYVQKTFSLIFKFYRLIIKYSFKIIKITFKTIYRVIDVLFRILFRILPTILKDILAYILAVPFLIFSPLYEFFAKFGKYFAFICWSDTGFIYDLTLFLGLTTFAVTEIDIDELEKSATLEEDIKTSSTNTKKDGENSKDELKEDGEELNEDGEELNEELNEDF